MRYVKLVHLGVVSLIQTLFLSHSLTGYVIPFKAGTDLQIRG